MQQPDYYYQYTQQNPNPNPNITPTDHYSAPPTTPFPPPPYSSAASAPPYSTNYPPPPPPPQPDYQSYPPYPQNPDHGLSPTAPSYSQPAPLPQFESHTPYQSQLQQPQSYFSQTTSNYNPNPSPTPNYQYNPYENLYPYESTSTTAPKFDQIGGAGGYADDNSGRYGGYDRVGSNSGHDFYGGGASRYGLGGYGGDDGAYAYQGGKVEPYGARGTGSKSSMWKDDSGNNQQVMFDDFGRPIGLPGSGSSNGRGQSSSAKIVKAVPKADTQQDAKGGGVQKFRVKLLAESGGQSTTDVLCQIGLDGIRMLDPSTSRTLRIYPLDTITRCEVIDSSTFTFWSKSSVDIDARRIRLQSNSYTTNTLLDTVTAATVQLKEIGGRSRPADPVKATEQPNEKKKGLGDWMNIIKPVNEEKDHWVPDEAVTKCTSCGTDFGAFVRRHHCRNCGDIFCDKCTHGRIALTAEENAPQVRVCDRCMAEVTQRLSNAKEAANRPVGLQSHEDLAKKLQEELERNRKSSSGSKSDGSGRRMKEVACPTCTVHLQVQVPSSGSETIECGVCQHPFLTGRRWSINYLRFKHEVASMSYKKRCDVCQSSEIHAETVVKNLIVE